MESCADAIHLAPRPAQLQYLYYLKASIQQPYVIVTMILVVVTWVTKRLYTNYSKKLIGYSCQKMWSSIVGSVINAMLPNLQDHNVHL